MRHSWNMGFVASHWFLFFNLAPSNKLWRHLHSPGLEDSRLTSESVIFQEQAIILNLHFLGKKQTHFPKMNSFFWCASDGDDFTVFFFVDFVLPVSALRKNARYTEWITIFLKVLFSSVTSWSTSSSSPYPCCLAIWNGSPVSSHLILDWTLDIFL